jgi:homoisocitrate dehydrogenase
MTRICIIEGDGIGQEVIPTAVGILQALSIGLEFVPAYAGFEFFQKTGDAIPAETLQAVAECDATLFGATSSPLTRVEGYRSPILTLRKEFDLYANLRPIQSLPGSFSRPGVDVLIVRENTEGLYAGREHGEGDTAVAERVITRRASARIARVAFEHARARKQRVTIVHKANVLKITDGLFRETCLQVAREFPDVSVDEMLVDAMAMRLVQDPESFDVIVTTNLFGDILSDEASALIGGLGVAPSANVGTRTAVFEPVHGSAPDIAGKGIANPLGAVLSAALLLDYVKLPEAATRVRGAVRRTVERGVVTPDLGGHATTREVTRAVIGKLTSTRFQFRPMDEASARQVLAWRYEPPYEMYNLTSPEDGADATVEFLTDAQNGYYVVDDERGELVAFCCFGADAQVLGGDYAADALDIGLGMRPDLTGRGNGGTYVEAVLDFARRRFMPSAFRVTIAAFNGRARRVWTRAGFQEVQTFERRTDGVPFVIMVQTR